MWDAQPAQPAHPSSDAPAKTSLVPVELFLGPFPISPCLLLVHLDSGGGQYPLAILAEEWTIPFLLGPTETRMEFFQRLSIRKVTEKQSQK